MVVGEGDARRWNERHNLPCGMAMSESGKPRGQCFPDNRAIDQTSCTRDMLLDREVCDRARLARDARFDGRFFSGVVTTGVYCRPICPVRPAGSQNVRFFPSAAAAERAGFRPCLRCRPEAAPGTPAWQGSASVVSRGLALINRGFLDEHGSGDLAAFLGVGNRQLTRLFMNHLGATPGAVARTRRVQMAKRLLDETTMSVTEIAFAAGFSSIRRFNAVFAETYGRPPSQTRRSSPIDRTRAATIRIRLAYRPPFHWPTLAALLASEAIPGVEAVDGCAYRRTISVDGRHGWLEVSPSPGEDCLALMLCLPRYAKLRSIVERVRALFDLNADPARIGAQLVHHPQAARLLAEASDLRLPGAWDGFELAIRTLVVNDVGHADVTGIMRRLAENYGVHLAWPPQVGPHLIFPTAGCLAEASLSGYGLSRQTVNFVNRLARAVRNGKICFSPTQTFEDLVSRLRQTAAFDRPTANWIAMRTLGEPDAVPFGARTVRGLDAWGTAELADHESWRPWRSYVAVLLASAGLRAGAGTSGPLVRRSVRP